MAHCSAIVSRRLLCIREMEPERWHVTACTRYTSASQPQSTQWHVLLTEFLRPPHTHTHFSAEATFFCDIIRASKVDSNQAGLYASGEVQGRHAYISLLTLCDAPMPVARSSMNPVTNCRWWPEDCKCRSGPPSEQCSLDPAEIMTSSSPMTAACAPRTGGAFGNCAFH